ncbi:class I SAM-dependent methyltransferase [Altibacter sp.]|uniref:class I SAM-dependent methyltransferase n=1 Tax=Altibacter sp. TaxID=2024823 RepID=UPI000C980BFA|nr:class I SAM-dependent methyltransferase [Altibacter sp.]MAP54811.1 hypothetical protein [Altibacter sp.]
MKKTLQHFLNRLPYIRGLHTQVETYKKNACYPPGHYYSPIVSVEEVKAREEDIWKGLHTDGIPGIALNTEAQKALVRSFAAYYAEMPYGAGTQEGLRYRFDNPMYTYTDGIFLYSMLRHLTPKRMIEVGSGYSSSLMLDVNELFFSNAMELTFIEPYPKRLLDTISEEDASRSTLLEKKVQDVPLSFFETLEKGDILFIDSTHVSKCGSDVNYILFDILPVLAPGVFIHFHDIFYPFEYPKGWVYGGRNWNENYILRAFLMHNETYSIRLFSHYLHQHHSDLFEALPLARKNAGGNLWIEKTA